MGVVTVVSTVTNTVSSDDMTVLGQIVKLVADNGIMIILSAAVIMFVFRIMNVMINQNTSITSSILPKIDELQHNITDLLMNINKLDTNQTMAINKQFNEVRTLENDIMSQLNAIDRQISTMSSELDGINEKLASVNMYLQLTDTTKKDKTDN